jgi:hypothetical protein
MAADLPAFRARFPEFNNTGDAYITTQLADAAIQVDVSVFGQAKADLATLYLAAHTLALSPFGNSAKLVSKVPVGKNVFYSTTYGTKYFDLCKQVGSGGRVV